MFEHLERLPVDPILGLAALCEKDPSPDKVDLTVGIYKDENGDTPVFEAVRLAQWALTEEEKTKAYIAQAGDADFNAGLQRLLLGADNAALLEGRVSSVQTPGGCGGLRIGAELIKAASDSARVWVSAPTWPNHIPLIGSVGLEIREYRYYNPISHDVDIDGMLEDLAGAAAGDVVLLHGCCHNPCGADLSHGQWQAVASLCAERGLMPFIDIAYQGLGDGLEEDAWGLRHVVATVPEVVIAASCSKNLGLYRERTGATVFVGKTADSAEVLASQGMKAARKIYSMPPAHGAILAGKILTDQQLGQVWREELAQMCQRINSLRIMLDEKLSAATDQDFSFIRREKGMFSFLGLTEAQVDRLREEFSVYMVGSSRINVAGVNSGNVDYLASAVARVL
jgi:aspartate aminotransferase